MRRVVYSAVRNAARGALESSRARLIAGFPERSFQPRWAPAPLLKQREQNLSAPRLSRARPTRSARAASRRCAPRSSPARPTGRSSSRASPARSRPTIVEEDGRIVMERTARARRASRTSCRRTRRSSRGSSASIPGRDFVIPKDGLHEHGTSSIKYGRGAVLTVDLTNRCNMMCDPCFMDANQVGYVHELEWDEVQKLLDDAPSIKPRRQMTVQFSGGEPTLSPHFLPAIRYARKIGYFSVQCATNGIRFAQDAEFAQEADEAGPAPRLPPVRRRRQRGQPAPQGRQPLRREAARDREPARRRHRRDARRDDRQRDQQRPGRRDRRVRASRTPTRSTRVSFQPVSFTGRDEDIDDETRKRQRYTLSHLAHDVKTQTGIDEADARLVPALGVGAVLAT